VRLTVPPVDYRPPESLKLTYQSGNAYFNLTYADAKVDLRLAGPRRQLHGGGARKAVPARPRRSRPVRPLRATPLRRVGAGAVQAAYVLSLLRDPKSEPLVARSTPTPAASGWPT
jgi:hypothetical protein